MGNAGEVGAGQGWPTCVRGVSCASGVMIVKRVGHVDDIAGVVQFLASPAARYITAQTIHVNGGAWMTR